MSLIFLKEEGLELDTLITDRHRQNNKWIRENLEGTKRFYDIWHVGEGMYLYRKSLVSHLGKGGSLLQFKWYKVIGHIN